MDRRTVMGAMAAVAGAAALWPGRPVLAAEPRVYTGLISGVGAGGYDVVAYFERSAAVAGDPAIVADHEGVAYRFSTAANREAFKANPSRFLPQYGGYCAWAVSKNYTAKGDPNAWSIVDGKLYLNYNKSVRSDWSRDTAGNIAAGDKNWPTVLK